MKTFKLLTIAGLFLASLAASYGQLISTTVAPSAENAFLRTESPHVLNTGALHVGSEFVTNPDFGVVFDSPIPYKHNQYLAAAADANSLLWTKQTDAPLISVSEGFYVDVTFIRGVGDTFLSTFGVKFTNEYGWSNNRNIFTNYDAGTPLTTVRLSTDDYYDLEFWAFNLNIGKEYVGDSNHFDVYSAFDFNTFKTSYMIGVNNLLSLDGFCYSDAVIRVDVYAIPTNPEDPTPVPEPSTYGLIGAATLLGFVAYRRKFSKK